MPQGWDLGVLDVKNLSVGICDGAPSTAHSIMFMYLDEYQTKLWLSVKKLVTQIPHPH